MASFYQLIKGIKKHSNNKNSKLYRVFFGTKYLPNIHLLPHHEFHYRKEHEKPGRETEKEECGVR